MESWEADLDNTRLRAAEEFGDTYEQEQGVVCEVCERTVDEVFSCAGCGEIYGCKRCMHYHPDIMKYFCDDDECVREYERKQRKERPGFEGVFNA